jgi:CubicO group peptidase (beta-lactamase class C family)
MKILTRLLIAIVLGFSPNLSHAQTPNDPKLAAILEPIRVKYQLPALAAATFNTDGIEQMAAMGVRKSGTDVAVTADDLWHLGSDTKVMTAMLAGTFVVEKKLSWDDKVITYFPDLEAKIPAAMKEITISQVLRHQAGLSDNLSLWQRGFLHGSTSEQRLQAAADILETPAYPPGAFHYANNDYILIGAILEKLGGKPWVSASSRRSIWTPPDFGARARLGRSISRGLTSPTARRRHPTVPTWIIPLTWAPADRSIFP